MEGIVLTVDFQGKKPASGRWINRRLGRTQKNSQFAHRSAWAQDETIQPLSGGRHMRQATVLEMIDRHTKYIADLVYAAEATNDLLWSRKLLEMAGHLREAVGECRKKLPA